MSSWKSTVLPASSANDDSSTATLAPSFSNTASSSSRESVGSRLNWYWKPEHPPGSTERRNSFAIPSAAAESGGSLSSRMRSAHRAVMKMRSVAALLKPILDIMRGAASKEPNPVRLRGMRESIEPLEGAATHPRAGCA
eukprot:CAMPEP_0181220108 /NCGR_PEP_ID=MMETSP1096-20121128/28656_1 /TAXON_ID=156174 ORGANISM="Chrysochromulina ericina, Strain CCMP281" /NCGR_SAMPLE_ID=MMETSP1096 /ASSEMBLY_ACC=CAM_ASM_000453 /LENGTH=138 /DNA_ID=CAMNT_0023312579 /DNA_START=560 /DNA_END=972 /DNA_ORIENTATION=-